MPVSEIRGAILAGGAARRYGGVRKGLLEVGGRRILDRVASAVASAISAAPVLVTNDPEADSWTPGLAVVRDVRPGCGSLGGIYTAVISAPGPVLCVAWDMPFVTTQLLAALVRGAPGFDAFLPESNGPRGLEPLCGVYGPACVPAIERQLATGNLAAVGFHGAVRVGTLPLQEVRRSGDPDTLFLNVNSAVDLERAERLRAERGL